MKNINHVFTDISGLKAFIDSNIKNSDNILVQIFSGLLDDALCKDIAGTIKEMLPEASIIGTTTAGGVVDGKVLDLQIIVSFSIFETTKIASRLYLNEGEDKCAAEIVDDLVVENTKAIIIFTDGLNSDGEKLLREITRLRPSLVIAGGKAGDHNEFEKTFIFNETRLTEHGCIAASLSGDDLIINNNYMLNCDAIGIEMTVTRSDRNRVYTINDVPASQIYRKYLGEDVYHTLPQSGMAYPFLLERDGVTVSRSPIGAFEDGSMLYAGNLNEGEKIKFGFANIDMIQDKVFDDYNHFKTLPIEATYIYSCMGRMSLLGKYLDIEFGFLQNLGSTVGFLTFGEYFHGNKINELLNLTTTFLSVSESSIVRKHEDIATAALTHTDTSMKVLTHLVRTTSQELNDLNKTLKLKAIENEKIRQSLNNAQALAHIGSWEWDIQNGTLKWSDEIYRIFGLEPQEFTATYEAFLSAIHPDDRELVANAVTETVQNSTAYNLRHRIVRPDGTIRIVDEKGEVTRDASANPLLMLGAVQDVTELLKSQNELEEYKNSLELKVKAEITKRTEQEAILMQQSRLASMGEMIGNIAHQWRQPLNALGLVVANIKFAYTHGRLDEAFIDKTVEKSNRLVQKMSSTIDDFSNFFKPDKEKKHFSISASINDSLELAETLLATSNIKVEKELDDTIFIDGYHNEFSQVILNIINNAKDALVANRTDDRLITIRLTSANGKALLSISDNAGGIPAHIIERVFEPYFTTKEQGKGTGVGLYMSKLIIEEHLSGKITAANLTDTQGETTGAVFTITL